jgi:hypothetical protein
VTWQPGKDRRRGEGDWYRVFHRLRINFPNSLEATRHHFFLQQYRPSSNPFTLAARRRASFTAFQTLALETIHMSQTDQKFFFGTPPTANVEVHVSNGSTPQNNPADNPYVDPTGIGNSAGSAKAITIAGNVRFSNPA